MDHLRLPENMACLEKARIIYSAGFFITGERLFTFSGLFLFYVLSIPPCLCGRKQ